MRGTKKTRVSRREFLKKGATGGAGATAIAALGTSPTTVHAQESIRWDRVADVVIVGAGAAGLPAAIAARDAGASVLVVEENHDIGGHGMLSGGRIPLGGGTSMQKKYGIEDTPDQVYLDHCTHAENEFKYADRDLIRVWADENVPTFEFLIENGVRFYDRAPVPEIHKTPRLCTTQLFSDDLKETINGRNGSGLVRPLERSARAKGAEFLLRHRMTKIIRENPQSGRVAGITAEVDGKSVNLQARRGVIIATGGHTSNVEFRRMFDPRLTEEYQTTGEPWSRQSGDGEILAMAVGASLWGTGNQTAENGRAISKTAHIGARWGYPNLKWNPAGPIFGSIRASGLTVRDYQNLILVNQIGQRFWNEVDDSYAFINAALGTNGNLGKSAKRNGGGPIWAIFDSAAVAREKWTVAPPHVDPDGWFFTADTIGGLAARIANQYQLEPMPARALEETVARYNAFVDAGRDDDYAKPTPMHKIATPPFYAAWATPILHDTLTGLRINTRCEVIDLRGQPIPGLYCAGEAAGGFALHGLPRVTVFGRIAGREAARANT